ncbi:tyrosine-type recombinase/integrase [Pseudorhodoferax aquiterrae]|uniref:tyrosine-type recombinase/integrase n=1 Tax=Pseudorhodoferax aquiterrae TaxID=747304 RepID=UPI00167BD841|nr:tyrosine-type recombinase/integrase [Pseudorhodoferax aquiterrae]
MHLTLHVDASQLGGDLLEMIRKAVAAGRVTAGQEPQPRAPARAGAGEDRTVSQWLVVYREILARKTLKPATRVNTASNLKHVDRLWGGMPIRSLKPRTILAALQDGLGTASLRARVQALMKDVCKQAVLDEWIDSNPVLALDSVRPKIQRKRLSLEAFDAVAEQAVLHPQGWVAPMVLLGLATGQRRADLAKMRFDDVVDGHLHVEQQKEAGKGYGARLAIPLSLRLDAIGLKLGEVIEICRGYAAPGPTLLRQASGLPLEKSNLSARFTEIMRAAFERDTYGPGEWPSLHELRSLSERLYRAQGVDTQALLGHTNQAMTDRYNDDRGLTAREFKRVKIAPDASEVPEI